MAIHRRDPKVDDDGCAPAACIGAARRGNQVLQALRDIRGENHFVAVQLSENASRSEARHRPPALRARNDASMLKAKQSADPLEEAAEDTPGAEQAAEPRAFGNAAHHFPRRRR